MSSVLVVEAKNVARAARRMLGLSPMCSVIRELRSRGIDVARLDALECFAFTGAMHTRDYAPAVRSLELWEIHAGHEPVLRAGFPGSTVRITDTYAEIARTDRRFGFVVVDNSPVHAEHIEHFDLFPAIFRVLEDEAIVVLDVIPHLNDAVLGRYPEMFRDTTLEARRRFFNASDPRQLLQGEMLACYAARAADAGFRIEWSFSRKRNAIITYFVLRLVRVAGGSDVAEVQPEEAIQTRRSI
jgi:hypothetical protein